MRLQSVGPMGVITGIGMRLVCLTLLIAISASSALAQESRTATPQSKPWYVPQPVYNWWYSTDSLQNPSLSAPPINGPNPRQFSDISKINRQIQQQYPQVMPRTDQRAWYQRIYDNTMYYVQPVVQPVVQLASNLWNWTTEWVARLGNAIDRVVNRPRMQCYTPNGGRRVVGGNVTKGCCKQAVKEILRESGVLNRDLPGGSATEAERSMPLRNSRREALFERVSCNSSADAAPGTLVFYSTTRHPHGHVEIRRPDNGQYCSDYCSARGADMNARGRFTLTSCWARTAAVDQ